jgi:hypothetical protein
VLLGSTALVLLTSQAWAGRLLLSGLSTTTSILASVWRFCSGIVLVAKLATRAGEHLALLPRNNSFEVPHDLMTPNCTSGMLNVILVSPVSCSSCCDEWVACDC